MSDPDLLRDTCIDVYPDQGASPVRVLPDGALELVLPTASLWDNGRTLDFHFLGGTEAQKAQFRDAASQWSRFANLIMKFDQPIEHSEFRVDFTANGNWSFSGTDNLGRPPGSKTMNIYNMDYIIHEVGHAIGCAHEHSSPAGDIEWNKPVVYQALGGPPNNWSHDMVDRNVFFKYTSTSTQYSSFDPSSVMLYYFPASWTLNGVGTNSNRALSDGDKAFANRCYPGCSVDFSKPNISSSACVVSVGPETLFNARYGNSWIMHHPNSSFIEVRFHQPKTYGGQSIYSAARLKLVHLTSMNGPHPGNSPVDIIVNGNVVKHNYSPPSGDYITEAWDVTRLLADGDNVVRINLKSASTNYWINGLKLECDRILR